MDKFFIWVGRNRKVLGYSIGGLALLSGILNMTVVGHAWDGGLTAIIGLIVLADTASSI